MNKNDNSKLLPSKNYNQIYNRIPIKMTEIDWYWKEIDPAVLCIFVSFATDEKNEKH